MSSKRIISVDIFRGMTVAFMILVNTPGTWAHIYQPLDHAKWHGITPTDWIFPFFLFIVGTSIVLAYHYKRDNIEPKVYKKIIVRSIKIILLGLLLAGFTYHFPFFKNFSKLRLPGVLQRIGLVFLFTALIFIKIKKQKWYLIILLTILIGYWYGMTQIPINGEKPKLTKTHNLASVIDRAVLGTDHMWKHYEENGPVQGDYDPEGLFSTLPAIATAILGIFLGLILISNKISPYKKTIIFIALGLFLFLLGLFWSRSFPLNKRLWTSSYVLYTGGLAFFFFGLIYLLVDVLNYKNWGKIFIFLGSNAVLIFTLSVFIAKSFYLLKMPGTKYTIHGWIFHHLYVIPLGNNELSSFLYALSVVIFYIFVAWWFYNKKIFIKI